MHPIFGACGVSAFGDCEMVLTCLKAESKSAGRPGNTGGGGAGRGNRTLN
jgi:hypothetical protein